MVYSFQATVAARGYHVYKNTTWDQAKVGDKVLIDIESDKKIKRNLSVLLFHQNISHPANQNSWTHPKRNFSTRLFLPQR